MGREEILNIDPRDVTRLLTIDEILHMGKVLGAYWHYDYDAALAGRPGSHAITKSGFHTDEFLISRILLAPDNIRKIFAGQIVMLWKLSGLPMPDYVIGVPTGATDLARDVAQLIGARFVAMEKVNGRIVMPCAITGTVMLIEDLITRATGLREAIGLLASLGILDYIFVIINRGLLEFIEIAGIGKFKIESIAGKKTNLWPPIPDAFPLCNLNSKAVYPKLTDNHWEDLINSQNP